MILFSLGLIAMGAGLVVSAGMAVLNGELKDPMEWGGGIGLGFMGLSVIAAGVFCIRREFTE